MTDKAGFVEFESFFAETFEASERISTSTICTRLLQTFVVVVASAFIDVVMESAGTFAVKAAWQIFTESVEAFVFAFVSIDALSFVGSFLEAFVANAFEPVFKVDAFTILAGIQIQITVRRCRFLDATAEFFKVGRVRAWANVA